MGPGELIFSRDPPSTYQQLVAEPAGHAGLQNLVSISGLERELSGGADRDRRATRSNRFGT